MSLLAVSVPRAAAQTQATDAWKVTVAPYLMGASMSGTAAVADQELDVDGSKAWFDPNVGVQLRTPENGKRWHAQVYTEIGGFGVGSTFSWQVFPTFGINLSKSASLEFGYRWLDINYDTGEGATYFKYDVLSQGPVGGFRVVF